MGYRVSRALLRASFFTGITAAAVVTTLGVASAQLGQPEGITDETDSLHNLYLLVTAMGVVVWLLVTGALVFMLVRFKRRSDELPPQIHGNNVLEIIWTGIPIIIVLVLFVFSFIVLIDVDDSAADQDEYCEPAEGTANDCVLTINVTGFQFSWIFDYDMQDLGAAEPAEGTVSVQGTADIIPQLVLPIDEPVEFVLNSADVIHSFYIRNSLYKLDVNPGRENTFVITPTELGTYDGQCAELCGLNHEKMRFSVRIVPREEFDAWIAENAETPEAEEAAARPR